MPGKGTYICVTCGRDHHPTRKGRCKRCDQYFRVHGSEWPNGAKRIHGIKPCQVCGKEVRILEDRLRCKNCYQYQRKVGRDRTREELVEAQFLREARKEGLKRCGKCREIKPFADFYANQTWCKPCQLNRMERTLQRARRRARLHEAFIEDVDPADIYERDHGKCQLCGLAVPRAEATMDHIVPLARGGMHEKSNVQLAHRVCNSRKGTRPMAEQLRLIG